MGAPEPDRFFDGGSLDGAEPPDDRVAMQVVLERVVEPRPRRFLWWHLSPRPTEQFLLLRRIAYRDRVRGVFVVPGTRTATTFRTDLMSVPSLFTWLVPRTGLYLPAALLHDGLVGTADEPSSYDGPEISRVEADRILRDAMFDLRTSWVRRWLTWTAVTLGTVAAGVGSTWWTRAYFRTVVFGSLLVIAVLGVCATLDLFDLWDGLPWMGQQPFRRELQQGALFAVVVPSVLSVLWWGLWRAGLIAGVSLALLLHVTVALAVLAVGFWALDAATRPRSGPRH